MVRGGRVSADDWNTGMTVVRFDLSAIRQGQWYEHLIRFVLGGLATVLAGVIAALAGPFWGGLFLAFPAIFCASSTLIEKHERRKKEIKNLQGTRRGQQAAALDAFGAMLGSFGMAAFALTVLFGRSISPPIVLGLAAVSWLFIAIVVWSAGRVVLRRFKSDAPKRAGRL